MQYPYINDTNSLIFDENGKFFIEDYGYDTSYIKLTTCKSTHYEEQVVALGEYVYNWKNTN